jgi:hypothetical protein
MRILLIAAVVLCGCCGVSEETRDLAWGISQYQQAQVKSVEQLAAAAVEKEAVTAEEANAVIDTQKALATSCQSLLEIVGQPKTIPELAGPTEVTDE